MGRPPSSDKVGIKKGPWTPEEDIILVSYIQEHGPGNWTAVPTNTGLLRCSKSCRLRWTNYLRPGIKRGNFTLHEQGMIIHLQALLGNKWAAIASYLPQRTDNDIKNFWNTHLKKKIKKLQSAMDPQVAYDSTAYHHFASRSYIHERGIDNKNHNSGIRSTENSSAHAFFGGWIGSSFPLQDNTSTTSNRDTNGETPTEFGDDSTLLQYYRAQQIDDHQANGNSIGDQLDCVFPFDSSLINTMACEKSSCDSSKRDSERSGLVDQEKAHFVHEQNPGVDNDLTLSFLDENWVLDESASHEVGGDIKIPLIL